MQKTFQHDSKLLNVAINNTEFENELVELLNKFKNKVLQNVIEVSTDAERYEFNGESLEYSGPGEVNFEDGIGIDFLEKLLAFKNNLCH